MNLPRLRDRRRPLHPFPYQVSTVHLCAQKFTREKYSDTSSNRRLSAGSSCNACTGDVVCSDVPIAAKYPSAPKNASTVPAQATSHHHARAAASLDLQTCALCHSSPDARELRGSCAAPATITANPLSSIGCETQLRSSCIAPLLLLTAVSAVQYASDSQRGLRDSRFVPQWLTALPFQRGTDAKKKYAIQCPEAASQLLVGPHSI